MRHGRGLDCIGSHGARNTSLLRLNCLDWSLLLFCWLVGYSDDR